MLRTILMRKNITTRHLQRVYSRNYQFNTYISEKKKIMPLEVTFYSENEKKLKYALTSAQNIMQGVNFIKDLQMNQEEF
jgi:leucyl aminopeptidase